MNHEPVTSSGFCLSLCSPGMSSSPSQRQLTDMIFKFYKRHKVSQKWMMNKWWWQQTLTKWVWRQPSFTFVFKALIILSSFIFSTLCCSSVILSSISSRWDLSFFLEISQIDHISPQRGHISNIPGLNESLTSINERPTTYLLYRHVACYLFFTWCQCKRVFGRVSSPPLQLGNLNISSSLCSIEQVTSYKNKNIIIKFKG